MSKQPRKSTPKPADPAYPPPYETPPEPDQQPRKRPVKPVPPSQA